MRGLPAVGQVDQMCEACLAGKQKRLPFPKQGEYRTWWVLELVHGDLCGLIGPETPNGSKYFLLLVDDRSRYMWVVARGAEEAWKWHACLGHVNMVAPRKMAWEDLVRGLPAVGQVDQLCEACLAGKQKRLPFPKQGEYRARWVLELVHSDLCGLIRPETPNGSKYFLLLVDDQSRYMSVAMLPSKERAAVAIKEIKAWAERESRLKLGALRTDRGGEFTSHEFAEY